jgi:hypothetical protein
MANVLNSGFIIAVAIVLGSCAPQRGGGAVPSEDQFGVTVEPAAGHGGEATFHAIASGGAAIREVRLLVNAFVDGRNACYVYYNANANSFALVNDSGAGSSSLAAGQPGSIENSQCILDGSGTKTTTAGARVDVALKLRFKPEFKGDKKIFALLEDANGRSTQLVQKGTWTVHGK